jgi:hypothetical protein
MQSNSLTHPDLLSDIRGIGSTFKYLTLYYYLHALLVSSNDPHVIWEYYPQDTSKYLTETA